MLRQVTPPATETVETSYKDLTEAITKALRLFEDPEFILLQERVEFLERLRDRINDGLVFRNFVESGCETVKQDGESIAAKMYRAVDSLIAAAIQDESPVAYNGINSTVANTDITNAGRNLDACASGMARIFKAFAHHAITTQINTETSSAEIIDRIERDIADIITLSESLEPLPGAMIRAQQLTRLSISTNFTTPFHRALEVKESLTALAASISLSPELQTRDTSPQDLEGEDNIRFGPEGLADGLRETLLSLTPEPQATDTALQDLESEDNALPTPADSAGPLNQDRPEGKAPEAGNDPTPQTQESDLEPHASHADAPTPDESGSPSESNEALGRLDTSEEDTINKQCELVGLNKETVGAIIIAANQEVTRQSVLRFLGAFERIKKQIEDAGLSSENAKEHALHLIKFGWTRNIVSEICELVPKIVRKSRALDFEVAFSDYSEGLDSLQEWNATLGRELKRVNDHVRAFLHEELGLKQSQVETVISHLTQQDYPTPLPNIEDRVSHLRDLYISNLEHNPISLSHLTTGVTPGIIIECMDKLFEFTEEDYQDFKEHREKSLNIINGRIDSTDSNVRSLLLRAITCDVRAQYTLVEKSQQNPAQNPTEHNALPEQNDQVGRVKMVLQRLYNIPDECLDDAARAVTYLGNQGGNATRNGIIKNKFNNCGERARKIEELLRDNDLISIRHGGGNKLTLESTALIQAALGHRIETETLHTRLHGEASEMEKTHE